MYESEILSVYRFSGIKSFPVDCEQIAKSIGYQIISYQEISETKEEYIKHCQISNDAYVSRKHKTIYCNNAVSSKERIRFSVAHELAHVIMLTDDENIANDFASNLLCPRPIVYALKLRTANEISKYFKISIQAANNVLLNMRQGNSRSYLYFPDVYGTDIIAYFGLKHKCRHLIFEDNDVKPIKYTAKNVIPPKPEFNKEKEKEKQKKIKTLQGKIDRARAKLITVQNIDEYKRIKSRMYENEKYLNLILGRDMEGF